MVESKNVIISTIFGEAEYPAVESDGTPIFRKERECCHF